MFWLVTGSSISECGSHTEALELLNEVVALRRSQGCTVWPPFRTDSRDEIYLITWNSVLRNEHVFVTSIRPSGAVRDGTTYEV
jgi:hypothetical protein